MMLFSSTCERGWLYSYTAICRNGMQRRRISLWARHAHVPAAERYLISLQQPHVMTGVPSMSYLALSQGLGHGHMAACPCKFLLLKDTLAALPIVPSCIIS